MTFEPDQISLKLDKSLNRADVEKLLEQQGDPANLNLSGLNLSVINFAGMNLSGAAFAHAHLNGANLQEANLAKATFNSARLNGVKGHRVRLDEADLDNASLIEAKLHEASFTKAHLHKTNLSGADLRRANLAGANLSGANLSETDLTGANLSKASLAGANLSRAILRDTDLSDADLRGAVLGGAKLDGARLDGANLSQVRLLLANLHKARLSQAILNEADFSWSDLGEANLSKADLSGAKLIETDLTGADLREANLRQANFSGANLSNARLVGADLREVNLSGATLTGAYLSDEQKEMLASSGDVLGLDQSRSAQELSDLEAAQALSDLEAARRPPEEVAHTANGFVSGAEVNGLGLDFEATAGLPPLEGATPDEGQAPTGYAETELPPLVPGLTRQDYSLSSSTFVGAAVSTVSILVKEKPLAVSGLVGLLNSLDRLHSCLGLIRQEKFAQLVEFYRSPDFQSSPAGGLSVKSLDAATGRVELTAADTAALPALNSLLTGISAQSQEFDARELAENVLENFSPDPGAVVKTIVVQILVESIRQLAAGPLFDLAEPEV